MSDSSVAKINLELLKIESHEHLRGIKRTKCPKCNGSRMYFCYSCYIYVSENLSELCPKVELPFEIDIIKHPKELDGKSTAIHAGLISPRHVKIYTYPSIPDYRNMPNAIMVYPDSKSELLTDVIKCTRKSENDNSGVTQKLFDKVVFIDSTWNQVNSIITDERLSNLKTVKLCSRKTTYWRKQHNCPDTYLATIEAIYLFLKEYHEEILGVGAYNAEYDNLLYFYVYFYNMVNKPKT